MSKQQFWALNIVGGVCALLILGTIVLGQIDNQLNQSAMAMQKQFNEVQQLQTTGRNLVSRIAQAAAKEPALQELLARHQPKADAQTPAKSTP